MIIEENKHAFDNLAVLARCSNTLIKGHAIPLIGGGEVSMLSHCGAELSPNDKFRPDSRIVINLGSEVLDILSLNGSDSRPSRSNSDVNQSEPAVSAKNSQASTVCGGANKSLKSKNPSKILNGTRISEESDLNLPSPFNLALWMAPFKCSEPWCCCNDLDSENTEKVPYTLNDSASAILEAQRLSQFRAAIVEEAIRMRHKMKENNHLSDQEMQERAMECIASMSLMPQGMGSEDYLESVRLLGGLNGHRVRGVPPSPLRPFNLVQHNNSHTKSEMSMNSSLIVNKNRICVDSNPLLEYNQSMANNQAFKLDPHYIPYNQPQNCHAGSHIHYPSDINGNNGINTMVPNAIHSHPQVYGALPGYIENSDQQYQRHGQLMPVSFMSPIQSTFSNNISSGQFPFPQPDFVNGFQMETYFPYQNESQQLYSHRVHPVTFLDNQVLQEPERFESEPLEGNTRKACKDLTIEIPISPKASNDTIVNDGTAQAISDPAITTTNAKLPSSSSASPLGSSFRLLRSPGMANNSSNKAPNKQLLSTNVISACPSHSSSPHASSKLNGYNYNNTNDTTTVTQNNKNNNNSSCAAWALLNVLGKSSPLKKEANFKKNFSNPASPTTEQMVETKRDGCWSPSATSSASAALLDVLSRSSPNIRKHSAEFKDESSHPESTLSSSPSAPSSGNYIISDIFHNLARTPIGQQSMTSKTNDIKKCHQVNENASVDPHLIECTSKTNSIEVELQSPTLNVDAKFVLPNEETKIMSESVAAIQSETINEPIILNMPVHASSLTSVSCVSNALWPKLQHSSITLPSSASIPTARPFISSNPAAAACKLPSIVKKPFQCMPPPPKSFPNVSAQSIRQNGLAVGGTSIDSGSSKSARVTAAHQFSNVSSSSSSSSVISESQSTTNSQYNNLTTFQNPSFNASEGSRPPTWIASNSTYGGRRYKESQYNYHPYQLQQQPSYTETHIEKRIFSNPPSQPPAIISHNQHNVHLQSYHQQEHKYDQSAFSQHNSQPQLLRGVAFPGLAPHMLPANSLQNGLPNTPSNIMHPQQQLFQHHHAQHNNVYSQYIHGGVQ